MVDGASSARYILAYLFWVVTVGISLLCAMLARTVYQYMIIFAGWNRYTIRAFDNFALIGLAVILVGVVVAAEHYYRTGVQGKRLFLHFSTFTLIEVGILAALQFMLLLMQFINGSIDLIAMGLFALMVLIAWLLLRWRSVLKQSN